MCSHSITTLNSYHRGKQYPFLATMLALFVVGCVRQIMPLPPDSFEQFSLYFTKEAWDVLISTYYPINKCKSLDIRGVKFKLASLSLGLPFNRKNTESMEGVRNLSFKLWLHRNILTYEKAPCYSTQYGYYKWYITVRASLY